MKNPLAACLVLALTGFVNHSALADSSNVPAARTENGYKYVFKDDPLAAGGNAPLSAQLRVLRARQRQAPPFGSQADEPLSPSSSSRPSPLREAPPAGVGGRGAWCARQRAQGVAARGLWGSGPVSGVLGSSGSSGFGVRGSGFGVRGSGFGVRGFGLVRSYARSILHESAVRHLRDEPQTQDTRAGPRFFENLAWRTRLACAALFKTARIGFQHD